MLPVAICFFLITNGCNGEDNQEPGPNGTTGTLKGVSLSPRSYEAGDFTDFFEEAAQAGEIIMWAGDWAELGTDGAPSVVAELSLTYDYLPLIEVTFFTQETGLLFRPLDETTRESYRAGVIAFVESYLPRYIGLGIEVNILYEKSPEAYEEYISFYADLYTSVKAASPETNVFTVFQLEEMKGYTFWSEDPPDPSATHWEQIERFPSDIVAFTTYPCLVFKDPSEIPSDYYSEIQSHTSRPVAFTEIGWHSAARPPGWESSETEQAQFVETFWELTHGLDLELAVWSFLFDQDVTEPFDSMGLLRGDGTPRPAGEHWTGSD